MEIPVNPEPSPEKEPLNEPLTPVVFVKSTFTPEPETTNEPVIEASPFLEPSHSATAVIPVKPVPSP